MLELKDYSFGQKARMLYNHIYFSDLPEAYKERLVSDDFFLEVLQSPNFNPRLIQWFSGYKRVTNTPAAEYRQLVRHLLEAPKEVWGFAFTKQISNASRALLLVLLTFHGHSSLERLESAWQLLHEWRAKRYRFKMAPDDFRTALRELEGSFIKIDLGRVGFLNPSIRDFVASLVTSVSDHATDVISTMSFFMQLQVIWLLRRENQSGEVRKYLDAHVEEVVAATLRLLGTACPRRDASGRWRGTPADGYIENRFWVVADVARQYGSDILWSRIYELGVEMLADWEAYAPSYGWVVGSMYALNDGNAMQAELLAKLKHRLLVELENGTAAGFMHVYRYARARSGLWTAKDQKGLVRALRRYMEYRFEAECRKCRTSAELSSLLGMLAPLSERSGWISGFLIGLKWKDVRRMARHERLGSLSVGHIRPADADAEEGKSIAEVKEMFYTLVGS